MSRGLEVKDGAISKVSHPAEMGPVIDVSGRAVAVAGPVRRLPAAPCWSRCRLYGGGSTGPKTVEGRARITKSNCICSQSGGSVGG